MITDYDVSSQDILMYFSPLFPVITIVSTDHVYFHHKIVLMIVVIQNFQLEVANNSNSLSLRILQGVSINCHQYIWSEGH